MLHTCMYYTSLTVMSQLSRPVGWSRDGGVRETMRVELTSGGGAFPDGVWGSAVSSPIGVWGGAPAALQLLQC